jgi:hypothetical protein
VILSYYRCCGNIPVSPLILPEVDNQPTTGTGKAFKARRRALWNKKYTPLRSAQGEAAQHSPLTPCSESFGGQPGCALQPVLAGELLLPTIPQCLMRLEGLLGLVGWL